MSANRGWVQEPRGGEPPADGRGRREPVDLDRVMEVTFVFAFTLAVALYFGAAWVGAYLLGGWVGALALAVFMLPAVVYTLVKWNQRKVDREVRTDARHHREVSGGGLSGIRTVD